MRSPVDCASSRLRCRRCACWTYPAMALHARQRLSSATGMRTWNTTCVDVGRSCLGVCAFRCPRSVFFAFPSSLQPAFPPSPQIYVDRRATRRDSKGPGGARHTCREHRDVSGEKSCCLPITLVTVYALLAVQAAAANEPFSSPTSHTSVTAATAAHWHVPAAACGICASPFVPAGAHESGHAVADAAA